MSLTSIQIANEELLTRIRLITIVTRSFLLLRLGPAHVNFYPSSVEFGTIHLRNSFVGSSTGAKCDETVAFVTVRDANVDRVEVSKYLT